MKASYREMFDEVHASERLKEEVMNMTRQERTQVVKKLSVSFIIAAALAVILAGTALAAVIGVPETLQEWFGKQWTETGGGEQMPKEQQAVIDRLVQPINVSSVSKGVTITLDSVTPGEDGLWMLVKIAGTEEETRWDFMDFSVSCEPTEKQETLDFTISGYTASYTGMTEDNTQVQLIYYRSTDGQAFLNGGEFELKLGGMYCTKWTENEACEMIEREGRWALPFKLEPVGEPESLTAKSAQVDVSKLEWDEEGEELSEPIERKGTLRLQNIRVTSTGYRFERPLGEEGWEIPSPELLLKGGVDIQGGGANQIYGVPEMRGSWNIPVDLSQVESIRFGDVVVPLEQPKT